MNTATAPFQSGVSLVEGGTGSQLDLRGRGFSFRGGQEKTDMSDSPYAQPPHRVVREYLSGGEVKRWSGELIPVTSAIADKSGERTPIGAYPKLTKEAALEVLDGAVKAYDEGLGVWPSMTPDERIACVEKCLELFKAKRSEVVHLLMWEICKNAPDAEKEFDRTVEYIRDTIKEYRAMVAEGAVGDATGAGTITSELGPKGVALCIAPANYPLNESLTTVFPALLVGNTVIIKPAKQGVLLMAPLMDALKESFPPGVVSILFGDGFDVIPPLMKAGKIDAFAFIGSSGAAKAILGMHPTQHTLQSVLGLGAKNPGVVLPSADLDKAVSEIVTGALSFNGQRCTALKVLFVHRSVADQFVEKLSAAVNALPKGMPWEDKVKITPLYEPGKVEKMNEYVTDAVAHGARIVNEGGGRNEGALYSPPVLYPVTPEMKIFHEEQFGPVVPVAVFDDPREVITSVKGSSYRQQASVFGRDPAEVEPVARALGRLVPRVNINAQCQRGPDFVSFGALKDSGLGELSIKKALTAFAVERVMNRKER